MLELIVCNKSIQKKDNVKKTCRNACDLFDEFTGTCSINHKKNFDNPFVTMNCEHYLDKELVKESQNLKEHTKFKFSLIEEEADYLLDDEDIFHQLKGNSLYKREYSYPKTPDFSSGREDAYWFISSCGKFGCWIINNSNRIMDVPASLDRAIKGWTPKVYKSPVPLHDHKSSLSLASKIAWVVDEEGYGQYALLVNGDVSRITSPKPENWIKH